MPQIEQGSLAAWTTRQLLETFLSGDLRAFQLAFEEGLEQLPAAISYLTTLAGSTIADLARVVGIAHEDVLAALWLELPENTDQERIMMLDAISWWLAATPTDRHSLDVSESLTDLEREVVVGNYGLVMKLLLQMVSDVTGEPFNMGLEHLWQILGTEIETAQGEDDFDYA